MALDVKTKFWVVNIDDASEHLSENEFEQLQGLTKKVDILSKKDDTYHVFIVSKGNKTPRQSVGKRGIKK